MALLTERGSRMRWMWIDRFVEFHSGRKAVAIKCISLAEEQMDGYLPGYPIMPASLIIEGMAQTGGLLVAENSGFRQRVVLAKVGKAIFHEPAFAGDRLTYTAQVERFQPDGAMCTCTSHVGERLQCEAELVFAHLDDRFQGVDLFRPAELLYMLRVFRLYEVGRQADGSALGIPDYMLDAEREVLARSAAASSN
jgi:3-hydroxyacyl-[acyl-carrier-protein] dehydratase